VLVNDFEASVENAGDRAAAVTVSATAGAKDGLKRWTRRLRRLGFIKVHAGAVVALLY
jgi:hypothetical protein